jgi:mannose-6-phosphate isomerase-like protein (cupin superfamily)
MPKAIRKIALSVALVLIISVWATVTPGQSSGTSQGDKSVGQKYAELISYDVNAFKWFPGGVKPPAEASKKMSSTIKPTPLLDLDRVPGAFYMDFNWVGKGSSKDYLESEEHFNDFDEVIGLIGSKGEKDVHELGGEVEIWLGGEKYLITKSCLIFLPKGLRHCPLRFNRVDDSPILFFTFGRTPKYSLTHTKFSDAKSAERNNAKYISYDVNPSKVSAEAVKKEMLEDKRIGSTVKGTRLLDLDQVAGAFYTDFAWLWGGSAKGNSVVEHSHDFDEVIGFIGTKGGQKDPHDLGGEMEVWLGGEKHLLTKSCLIFVPKGLKHCPIRFKRIDAPILFFTVGMTGTYSSTPSYDFVTGH